MVMTKSNLGQDTGKSPIENGYEAREILKMLCSKHGIRAEVLEHCGDTAVAFVEDMVEGLNAHVTHWYVSGKQLFWLRDIKDKLVEKGII